MPNRFAFGSVINSAHKYRRNLADRHPPKILDNVPMLRIDKVSKLRHQFVSELKNVETQLTQELEKVRSQLSTLSPGSDEPKRQSRTAGTKTKTVSILSGKICPKCGKKGHDLRWHRWHDRKTAHDGRQRAS